MLYSVCRQLAKQKQLGTQYQKALHNNMSTNTLETPAKRGRPLERNSVRMSEAIVKLRLVKGLTLQAIADKYNAKGLVTANGDARTFTPQAIKQRINEFQRRNPEAYAEILGQAPVAEVEPVAEEAAPAPKRTRKAKVAATAEAEAVAA